jgi:hypothetical protein
MYRSLLPDDFESVAKIETITFGYEKSLAAQAPTITFRVAQAL